MTGLVGFDGAQVIALAHIGLAMVLGAVIGYEREWQRKPAGLRTNMLVSGAAAPHSSSVVTKGGCAWRKIRNGPSSRRCSATSHSRC
jgi:uncharacterized membrane protein YhiD involved in acid resistance